MRSKAFVLALTLGLTALTPWARAQGPAHLALAKREWSAWSILTGLSLDQSGSVWLADDQYLYRYDGARFVRASHVQKGILKYQDAGESRWLVDKKGGIVGWSPNRPPLRVKGPRLKEKNYEVTLWVDPEGNPYYLSRSVFVRVRDGAVEQVPRPPGVEPDEIGAIAFSPAGDLLLATRRGLWRLGSDGAQRIEERATLAVAYDPEGRAILFTAGGGLWSLGDGSSEPLLLHQEEPLAEYRHIVPTKDALWLVPKESGNEVLRLARPDFHVSGRLRLPLAPMFAIADRSGSLWAGHRSGIVMQVFGRLATTNPADDAGGPIVFTAAERANGDLWYTTLSSLVQQKADGTERRWVEDLPALACVRSIASLPNDQLAVATCNHGVAWYESGTFRFIDSKMGLANDRTYGLWPSLEGGVWVGFRWGGAQHVTREVALPAIPGFGERVTAFLESSSGGLWMASPAGVFQWHEGRLSRHAEDHGLTDPDVRSLGRSRKGWLLAGTGQQGLFKLTGDRWQALNAEQPYPSAAVFGIVEASDKYWFSSDLGVSVVDANALDDFLERGGSLPPVLRIDTRDGLRANRCGDRVMPSIVARAGGGVLVPTVMGLASISPPVPPTHGHLELHRLLVDGAHWPVGQGDLQVPSNASSLQAALIVSPLPAPHHAWVDVIWDGTLQRKLPIGESLLVTEIPDGSRTSLELRLRTAFAPEQVLSKVSLRIVRSSRFAQPLTWALGVLACVFIAFVWTALRDWRQRQQFSLVIEERNRIARDLHDTLAQGFTALGYHLKRLGRSLGAAPERSRILLEELTELLRVVRLESRHAIWDLRSEGLARRDLVRAVQELAEQSALASGADVRFSTRGTPRDLPEDAQTHLLRIAQEALANALGHGRATVVELTLEFSDKEARLSIADNGSGMADAPRKAGHFGMLGMTERAERLGGFIEFGSGAAGGVVVRVTVPLA